MIIRFINWYKGIDLKTKTAIFLLIVLGYAFALIGLTSFSPNGYGLIISAILVISIMSIGVYEVLGAFDLGKITIFSIIFGLILTMTTPFQYIQHLYVFKTVYLGPYVHIASGYWMTYVILGVSSIPLFFDKSFIYSRKRFFMFAAILITSLLSVYASKFALIIMSVNVRDSIYFLAISVITDTCASVFGKIFGRKLPWKLAPKISPNKTIVGFVFGYGFGVLFALTAYKLPVGEVFSWAEKPWDLRLAFALTAPLVAVIGDLFFSAIKRTLFIKDFSALIPGHGGIFDRIDSHLFVLAYGFMFYLITYENQSIAGELSQVIDLSNSLSLPYIQLPQLNLIIPQL